MNWGWWRLGSGHVSTARKHARACLMQSPFSPECWRLFLCAPPRPLKSAHPEGGREGLIRGRRSEKRSVQQSLLKNAAIASLRHRAEAEAQA